MAIIGYRSGVTSEDLDRVIAALMPETAEDLYALLTGEDRVALTRHVPAASFARYPQGVIFGKDVQIAWRSAPAGDYRVTAVREEGSFAEAAGLTAVEPLEPLAASETSVVLTGELRHDGKPFWRSARTSRPLDYPVPGKGARVLLLTGSYRLPDRSRITRLKGVTEC